MAGAIKKVAAGDCGIRHRLREDEQGKVQLFHESLMLKTQCFFIDSFLNDKLLSEQCLNDVNTFDQFSKV